MTVRLDVTDRDGNQLNVRAQPQSSLIEALRHLENGVSAICGGMCSCAKCHVYIEKEWMERLSKGEIDERDWLAALRFDRDDSRLSCQIQLAEQFNVLRVTLAPEEIRSMWIGSRIYNKSPSRVCTDPSLLECSGRERTQVTLGHSQPSCQLASESAIQR